jgi:dienelactone hydrolase
MSRCRSAIGKVVKLSAASRFSRKLVLSSAVVALAIVSQAACAKDPDFDEGHGFLRVVINGKHYRLDSLVVKPVGAKGPLPLALITNGTGSTSAEISGENTTKFEPRARDLAIRGWLAVVVIRRGYGRSDGSMPGDGCKKPHVKQDLDLAADDLQAAIDVLKKRPDVDASRIIAIGGSTGGATAIALGARNPPGLVGVVTVSGGLRLNCEGWEDELLKAYKDYGVTSHVPNLWLYAKNDSYFGPDLAERLRAAFANGGSTVDFSEIEPFNNEGHTLLIEGGMQWLGKLDDFLRKRGLPTWSYSNVSELMKRLDLQQDETVVADYFTAPTPKALAFSPRTKQFYYQYDGKYGLAANRDAAMAGCAKAGDSDCGIVMDNNRWVGAGPQ